MNDFTACVVIHSHVQNKAISSFLIELAEIVQNGTNRLYQDCLERSVINLIRQPASSRKRLPAIG